MSSNNYNVDSTSNLLKSLKSVHLPPPPSSTMNENFYQSSNQIINLASNQSHRQIQDYQSKYNQQPSQQYSQIQYNHNQSHRIPLQEQHYDLNLPNSSTTNFVYKVDSTPYISKNSSKDLTPPGTISVNKKRIPQPDTPLSKSKSNNNQIISRQQIQSQASSLLLSPAFSSPNQLKNGRKESIQEGELTSIPKPPSFTKLSQTNKKKAVKNDESLLPTADDLKNNPSNSDTKPPYSYATLIGLAILRAPGKRLTLSQIYQWISDSFRYYRRSDVGWQNSIRHNLSLNKAFVKGEKSKDGKGHYWCVEEGCESQFLKNKNSKKLSSSHELIMDQVFLNSSNRNSSSFSSGTRSPDSRTNSSSSSYGAQKIRRTSTTLSSSPSIGYRAEDPTTDPLSGGGSESDSASDSDSESDLDYDTDAQMNNSGQIEDPVPMSQIRQMNNDYPGLKRSNTAIGLQRYSLQRKHESDTDEDDNVAPPVKRACSSATTGVGSISKIPQLEAPISLWTASASGDHTVFDKNSLPEITLNGSPDKFNKPLFASKELPYTSSFSCNSNFDLSPVKPSETGPLLEPSTPAPRLNGHLKTPKSSMLTPLRHLKTPTSASIMRKLWYSPSYLDDFYTSPCISRPTTYDEDDIILRACFGSPARFNDRKRPYFETSGTYNHHMSDLFGVDVCSVVKRAVDHAVDFKSNLNHVRHSSSSTESDDQNRVDT